MTGTEIQRYVEGRLGQTVDPDEVLEAINEGLDEIGGMGLLYATANVTVTDTAQWYSLEPDYTQVKKVIKKEDGKEYIYQRWEYRNGDIRFFDAGEYIIVARKLPEHLSNIADTFTDLHRVYYNALKFYALAWVRENSDPESKAAQVLYERFENNVMRAAQTLLSTKAPAKVRVLRRG